MDYIFTFSTIINNKIKQTTPYTKETITILIRLRTLANNT